jgi:hypothetical protein
MTQEWYDAADQGSPYSGVNALFIDFQKALGLVDHEILLTMAYRRGDGCETHCKNNITHYLC